MATSRRPRRPKKKNNFFTIVILSVIGLMVVVVGVATLFKKSPEPEKPVVKKAKPVEKQIEEAAPVVEEASYETDDNYVIDRAPTPQFIKEHRDELAGLLDTKIKAAHMTLEVNKDPKQAAEIRRRILMAEKFKKRIESVDPNDKSTWFFMNQKDALKNNILEIKREEK